MSWTPLVLAALVMAGSASGPTRAVTSAPVMITVTIDQIAFRETSVSAHVGDTIEWTNKDVVDHTATAKTHAFNVVIPAGRKARIVLKQAGEIQYYCEYHPNMTAKVVVTKAP